MDARGGGMPGFDFGPERTSILAIVAFVFGVPCFVPGAGIVASLLAVFALVGISSSRGRVGGTGFAVAALVLGLFGTVLWTGVIYGAMQVAQQFNRGAVGPTVALVQAIEQKNWAEARAHLLPSTAERITDEQFETFRVALASEAGELRGGPTGLVELFRFYVSTGERMKPPGPNEPAALPIPINFAKGPQLMLIDLDPAEPRQPKQATDASTTAKAARELSIKNLRLMKTNRSSLYLIDPSLLPLARSAGAVQIQIGDGPKPPSTEIEVGPDGVRVNPSDANPAPASTPAPAPTPAPTPAPASPQPPAAPASNPG